MNTPYHVCPMAKQKRLTFNSNNSLAEFPFNLVDCDIWGPYHIPAHTGHKYFLTIVDDCTRFTWIYFLKNKYEASEAIQRFFNMIFTQFDKKIKIFRSDNAKELNLDDFFKKRGVLHQYCCVERPQQNSVVERKHQHLLNVARALFFQSHIPIRFWNECVSTTTYLINRTPSPRL